MANKEIEDQIKAYRKQKEKQYRKKWKVRNPETVREQKIRYWTRKAEQQGFETWREARNDYNRQRYRDIASGLRVVHAQTGRPRKSKEERRQKERERSIRYWTKRAARLGLASWLDARRAYNAELYEKNKERYQYNQVKFYSGVAEKNGLTTWKEGRRIYGQMRRLRQGKDDGDE